MVYELPSQDSINQTRLVTTNSKDLCDIHMEFGVTR